MHVGSRKGFTLIELLTVIAITSPCCRDPVPGLRQGQGNSEEGNCSTTCRDLCQGEPLPPGLRCLPAPIAGRSRKRRRDHMGGRSERRRCALPDIKHGFLVPTYVKSFRYFNALTIRPTT